MSPSKHSRRRNASAKPRSSAAGKGGSRSGKGKAAAHANEPVVISIGGRAVASVGALLLTLMGGVAIGSGILRMPPPPALDPSASLWLVLLTGLTTGGLSCLAVQGGLLATVIGQREQRFQSGSEGSHALPIALFLGSKLLAYTALGAVLGYVGSLVSLSPMSRGWLQVGIGVFMIGVAMQMLNVHPIFRYFALQPPKFIQRMIRARSKNGDALAPLFLGGLTVLIPCGVTQAMELVAMGTGSPFRGALVMFAFTLGTSPVFFILGLLATRLSDALHGTFVRVAAAAIVVMAFYSLLGGARLVGIMPVQALAPEAALGSIVAGVPGSSVGALAEQATSGAGTVPSQPPARQDVVVEVRDTAYVPNRIQVRAGIPTRLSLVTNNTYGCTRAFVIPSMNFMRVLPTTGTEVVEFTPTGTGQIWFMCSMGMYGGVIEVIG